MAPVQPLAPPAPPAVEPLPAQPLKSVDAEPAAGSSSPTSDPDAGVGDILVTEGILTAQQQTLEAIF